MSKFVAWPSIQNFHGLRKYLTEYPEALYGVRGGKITYRAKVKLHGTNAGVRIDPNGCVTAFSRNGIITPDNDNMGFAKFVDERKEAFAKSVNAEYTLYSDYSKIFYGEWCGPKIQQGVAISKIPRRIFAVFAVALLDSKNNPHHVGMFQSPANIEDYISSSIEDVHVIPWFDDEKNYTIDWSLSEEEHNASEVLKQLNDDVLRVEHCDPFVKERFGVEGVGEGLVLFPTLIRHEKNSFQDFSDFAFKAKGQEHRTVRTEKAVQADAPTSDSVDGFARLVLGAARLEQGVQVACNGELSKRLVGPFLKWVCEDVEKECQAELAASGLSFKQARESLVKVAKEWYLAKC